MPNEPVVNLQLAEEHGLSADEFERIVAVLGRVPSFTELGIFSVMWSEHCSYKNSIALLKTLPRDGDQLLVKAGEENAGLVDIGGGLAVAFKIESHNHPSAVEPYQGAATGVGGILRDIFSMGARPIAALNSLRFGNLDDPKVRYLFDGVVKGIADYGNCFGVPTVGGEVYFDESYRGNPLVNCMAVGIVKHDQVARAIAEEKGSAVVLFGSATGRDGIHGATFASEQIDENSEDRRPQVQVGDPFAEKLLMEATLEMIREGHLIGIQDMGAAGITCSSSEMAAKGDEGIRLDLDKVPVRESGMSAYEILLSESQERMLAVVRKGHEGQVHRICNKWDLNSEVIGEVTGAPELNVWAQGKQVAQIPAESLVLGGGAPVYEREARRRAYLDQIEAVTSEDLPEPKDYGSVLRALLKSPNIASKEWVYAQYDHMVRSNTVVLPGSDAAVVRIKGTERALALSVDCNGRYVYLNPRAGARMAVAEAARNVVCSGGKPVAITNCLNFGNPYKPEIYWQFSEAIGGISEACRALGTPVTGGNVSFYNENPDGAVYPTPVIGMLGIVDSLSDVTTSWFKMAGDLVVLLGADCLKLGGSEYLKLHFDTIAGPCPEIDLDFEQRLQRCCLGAIQAGLVSSAHDVAEGGLAVALAECCFSGAATRLGAEITATFESQKDAALFGEAPSRIVLSLAESALPRLREIAQSHRVPVSVLGRVGGNRLLLPRTFDLEVDELSQDYFGAIRSVMGT